MSLKAGSARASHSNTARFSALGAACLFSTGGAAIKGTALTAFQVASFRSGVAALALVLLLPESRRGFRLDLLPAAFSYAGTLACFVIANKLTTGAAAIFLQSTAPIWVILLAPWLIGESMRTRDLPYLAAAALGLLLVFLGSGGPAATAPHPALGNVVALGSGFFYALLLIFFRRLAKHDTQDRTLPATVMGNALACLLCAPFAFPVETVTTHDALSILYLGVVQIGLAYWLFTRALRKLPALEVALLILLEPVLNPLWTWLTLDERPSNLALAGGGVMIAALAAKALFDRAPEPLAVPLTD